MRKHKKWITVVSVVLALSLLTGCGLTESPAKSEGPAQDNLSEQIFEPAALPAQAPDDYIRAVWVSYLDLYDIISDDQQQYTQKLEEMLGNLESIHTTDIFFQVRAFGESLYNSQIFTLPNRLFASYDPEIDYLGIAVQKAHERGMRIHAWINPYRLGSVSDEDTAAFCEPINQQSPGAITEVDGRMWIDPSNAEMQSKNIDYISELMSAYEFDGLHFDDYFYATDDTAFDEYAYTQYTEQGGELPLDQWRRQNVLDFVGAVYAKVKEVRPQAVFGISPDASIDRDVTRHYIDVRKICAEEGYVDYICPQIYFGYENETMPYLQTLTEWSMLCTSCDLIAGLSFYKSGTVDEYAGSGQNEWLENSDIISRQYLDSLTFTNCKGVALFRYNSIFNPASETMAFTQLELDNYKQVC